MMGKQGGTKKPLKEKFVQIYESFFQGDDPSKGNPNFWDELFLLRVNMKCIESQFDKLTTDELLTRKEIINNLFFHCVRALRADHQIRIVNALQTLCALVRGVCRKGLSDYCFDVIDLLIGFDVAEHQMQQLTEHLCDFLTGVYPSALKSLVLKFLLVLVTATENVSQNALLEYLMMNSVFEAIVQLLSDPQSRLHHGYDAILLLTILVNYRKYEATNPYIVKLSIVDDELALNGYGQVLSLQLSDYNRKFVQQQSEPPVGFLSSFTSLVGSVFLPETETFERPRFMSFLWLSTANRPNLLLTNRANDAVLLALYEAVHLNRNFVTTLTHSQTASQNPATPIVSSEDDISSAAVSFISPIQTPPSNLLATFLEFCSIVMQSCREENGIHTCKLCFVILACIAEDQYGNSVMHDVNMVYKVQLHRTPMRHRKVACDRSSPSKPLACALLDLMVEFVLSHMRRSLLIELYTRCMEVIHRLLCYQKKSRIRLQYNWKELWTALITLLRYLLSHEADLVKKYNIFQLAVQVINIFNLFITYGDTFLPSPSSYDELYYEVVRMHEVFDNMYSLALRYSTGDGEWKEAAGKLTNNLVNVRAIINHFTPKIDSWSVANRLSALTEEQVLHVVRSNYDTLTLKLHDNLDQFERYSETPRESPFFTHMIRSVVSEYRHSSQFVTLEQQSVLQDFSTIL